MSDVTFTFTHRAACTACNVPVGLRPALMVRGRRWDAIATVVRGQAVRTTLPVLADPTVRWECPACDAAN